MFLVRLFIFLWINVLLIICVLLGWLVVVKLILLRMCLRIVCNWWVLMFLIVVFILVVIFVIVLMLLLVNLRIKFFVCIRVIYCLIRFVFGFVKICLKFFWVSVLSLMWIGNCFCSFGKRFDGLVI